MNAEHAIDPQIQRALDAPNQSLWKRYAALTIGTPSLGRLLRHELVTGLLGSCPGGLGLALRAVGYRLLFPMIGRGTTIGRHVTLRGTARIRIGRRVAIDDQVVRLKRQLDRVVAPAEVEAAGVDAVELGRVAVGAGQGDAGLGRAVE